MGRALSTAHFWAWILASTTLFSMGCGSVTDNSSQAKSTSLDIQREASREIFERMRAASNATCIVPFFTANFDSEVERVQSGSSQVDMALVTLRDYVGSDFSSAALQSFAGAGASSNQWIQAARSLTSSLSNSQIMQALKNVPPATINLLKNMGANGNVEDVVRGLLVRMHLKNFTGRLVKTLATRIPAPPFLEGILNRATTIVGQALDGLTYMAMWCTAVNTAAAFFAAREASLGEQKSEWNAQQFENDTCARLNSHPSYIGKFCPASGGLSTYQNESGNGCALVDANQSTGIRVHADEHMGYGMFRVGKLMKVNVIDVKTLTNGFVVANVQVADSRSASYQSKGWVYVGGIVQSGSSCR